MITKLTKAQINKFPFYVEKWIKIGLNTDPINREESIKAVNMAYNLAGLEVPENIYFVSSPMEHIQFMKNLVKGSKKSFKDIDFLIHTTQGCYEASWLARYDFFRNECGLVSETDKILGLIKCAENFGWWATYANMAVIQDRPQKISRDSQNRLHCEDGPAILYRDGYSQFYWHGVFVSNSIIITNPEKITIDMIDNENNAEIRRIALSRFGYNRYVSESKMNVIDKEDDFAPYKGIRNAALLKKEMPGDEDFVVLMLNNSTPEKEDGSIKKYCIRVPPTMRTVKEASAWINFADKDTYNPIIET